MKVKMTKSYVEPKSVQKAVDREAPKTLASAGAYLRAIAMRSIKHRSDKNKESAKGTPPHNHTWIKKSIVFGVVPKENKVLIGPMYKKAGLANAARLQEFGGTGKVRDIDFEKFNKGIKIGDTGPVTARHFAKTKDTVIKHDANSDPRTGRKLVWIKIRTTSQAEHSTRIYRRIAKFAKMRRAYWPQRAYMGPALTRGTPKLTKFWQNSVRP